MSDDRWRSIGEFAISCILPAASLVVVLALVGTVLVCSGLVATGFDSKTLWDWLDMLVVPIAGVWLAGLFALARVRADRRAEAARELAAERTQVEALSAYLECMQTLITGGHLSSRTAHGPGKAMARARTFAALRLLNGTRKGILLRFLHEARMVGGPDPHVELALADLTNVDLVGADLQGINLEGANLRGADLHGAKLRGARLRRCVLSGADLGWADLKDATAESSQLATCRDLLEARLPDGTRVDEGVWADLLQR